MRPRLLAALWTALSLSFQADSYECDPHDLPQAPTELQTGDKCGGWCGALGACAEGLHCDRGLLPLAFMPWGSPLDTACRNPKEDNLLWTPGTTSCTMPQWFDVSSDQDLDALSIVVLGAVETSPVFRIDPFVRVLSAKKCRDHYVILIERIVEPPQQYVLTASLDGSARTWQQVTV
ncbi:hypothetical protein H257_06764 [Aphanomyces astaci]|uniref:Uncharacterized protein n=1 Tax=Aphanomyces astaci TaxID=112090 RepID=W4GN99_APHAT|nr:hypothetical protein H257_06764 [Aphanomyces astaci]ETV80494.1 hypothetical protein H257_06764 [Aphanomyces astaci]|eukprot:XP_009830418.1 hypothetical protein H257_06764 [Aphanomyces astaci]